ncbi:MAG: ankyrin repeat domain-containing protein, partial [Verrucomicrobiota bacterium]
VNAKDRRSSVWDGRCTPLHFACETGQIEMAGFLIDNGADPDCITQCWLNPLSTAITEKRQQLVELLLEKGASANGPEKCACPPLNAAAMIKDAALVKKLLQLGADPNRIGGWGDAALHSTHSFECARELVAGGANANLKDRSGTTALHCLLGVINPEYISLLIEAGANVNEIATDSGYTPLHILASLPSAENAKVLIEAGADVNVLSKQKQTPLDMCLYLLNKELNDNRERQRLADLLRQHGGKTAKEL